MLILIITIKLSDINYNWYNLKANIAYNKSKLFITINHMYFNI